MQTGHTAGSFWELSKLQGDNKRGTWKRLDGLVGQCVGLQLVSQVDGSLLHNTARISVPTSLLQKACRSHLWSVARLLSLAAQHALKPEADQAGA